MAHLIDVDVVHLLSPLVEDELPHVAEHVSDACRQVGIASAGGTGTLAPPTCSSGSLIVLVDAKQSGRCIHTT